MLQENSVRRALSDRGNQDSLNDSALRVGVLVVLLLLVHSPLSSTGGGLVVLTHSLITADQDAQEGCLGRVKQRGWCPITSGVAVADGITPMGD